MIREAKPTDLPQILRMAHAFHKASGLKFDLDEESIRGLFVVLTSDPNQLWVAAQGGNDHLSGMLGMMLYPHPLNANVKVAQELMWWADPGSRAGVGLLARAEKYAADTVCRLVQMGCLDDLEGERVANLYLKRGYVPLERTFARYL